MKLLKDEGKVKLEMITMEENIYAKPHAVCIPYPAQGHINPMMQLAKLLHHTGFYITFVHTEYNYGRQVKSRGSASVAGLQDFRFEAIPDGLPSTNGDVTQDIPLLSNSTSKTCLTPFKRLLKKLRNMSEDSPKEVPPLTCIVSDAAMSFTLDAAEEFGVPIALLWTASACGLVGYNYYPYLIDRGLIPLKDESQLTNGYLDTSIDGIPCMEGIRLRDLPSFLRTTNPDDMMFTYIIREIKRASRGNAIILNTFEALDLSILNSLQNIYKNVIMLPIGPLHTSLSKIPKHSPIRSVSASLWENDADCMTWLSSKARKSVTYVNFGSITVVSPKQALEFAYGLANSKYHFLWVIRPDLVAGEAAILPPDFIDGIKGRGFLTGWCDQEQVLNHPAIGGFLTHCGWNSILESITAGVPMVCWPFFAEQQTNCWFACKKWGIGMEMGTDPTRDEVEKLVGELMKGKKGKEMTRKISNWKRLAEEAVSTSGSSTLNFKTLVNQVLLSKTTKQTEVRRENM